MDCHWEHMPRDPFLPPSGFMGLDAAPPSPPMAEDFLVDTELELSGFGPPPFVDGRYVVKSRTPLANGLRLELELVEEA